MKKHGRRRLNDRWRIRSLAGQWWGELAFVQDPHPDEVVLGPDFGKLEVVKKFDGFGERVYVKQRNHVQLPTRMMLLGSVSPREDETVPTRKKTHSEKGKIQY
jgi:hypothetical protein